MPIAYLHRFVHTHLDVCVGTNHTRPRDLMNVNPEKVYLCGAVAGQQGCKAGCHALGAHAAMIAAAKAADDGAKLGWRASGLLIGAVFPFTMLVMMPVNKTILTQVRMGHAFQRVSYPPLGPFAFMQWCCDALLPKSKQLATACNKLSSRHTLVVGVDDCKGTAATCCHCFPLLLALVWGCMCCVMSGCNLLLWAWRNVCVHCT